MSDVQFRLLRDDEYDKLRGLGPDDTWIPHPAVSKVVVGECNGEIVAFWAMQAVVHLEPVWVAEEHRNSFTVMGHLINTMQILLSYLGVTNYFAFSDNESTNGYLGRLGFKKMPFEIWKGGEESCHSQQ